MGEIFIVLGKEKSNGDFLTLRPQRDPFEAVGLGDREGGGDLFFNLCVCIVENYRSYIYVKLRRFTYYK